MTHYDLSVSYGVGFFFSRQLGCEIGLSEPSTVAAAAPTYKPQIIPGRKKE